jgi:hypothetical protein
MSVTVENVHSATSPQSAPTLVYLLAASHSGSTLTAMLLNAPPDIRTAGELKANHLGDVDLYRCSCQELIRKCDFWNSVSSEMNRRGFEYDVRDARTSMQAFEGRYLQRLLRPLHRGVAMESVRDVLLSLSPSWRKKYPVWQDRNRQLIESVAAVSGVPFVADSSKIAVRLKYLLRTPGLKVKVVRIVRDGRAVSLTYVDPSNFADARDEKLRGGGTGKTQDQGQPMEQAANQWLRSNLEAEEVLRTMPRDDWIQIRYEDVCLKTRETMCNVYSFLGLSDDLSYERFRDVDHHIVGNGMRLDSSSEIIFDDRWRDVLSDADLSVFDRIAGTLNKQYGYQ